jgi:hypothetical protein
MHEDGIAQRAQKPPGKGPAFPFPGGKGSGAVRMNRPQHRDVQPMQVIGDQHIRPLLGNILQAPDLQAE